MHVYISTSLCNVNCCAAENIVYMHIYNTEDLSHLERITKYLELFRCPNKLDRLRIMLSN